MSFRKTYLLSILLMSTWAVSLHAQGKRVVTYIEDVQEERKSTRWTLTEWLRIKERMKMMDVWLAMFSDPKKDKFAPELSLQYGQSRGLSLFRYGDAADFQDSTWATSETEHKKEHGRLQFWFTNLVSSTTGLRTLDIDLGIEASFINRFMVEQQTLTPAAFPALATGTDKTQLSGVNLRIFGANEQDSFLVGKIGKFNRSSGFADSPFASTSGTYYGGEMALYFLRFLGAEGQYLSFKPQLSDAEKAKASNIEYGAFLEIYNVRFIYSLYDHNWSQEKEGVRLDSREQGRMLTLRLYF
ncbi:MAG TPA: hypothetical protein VFO10_14505 [Oligoflexus sp.]|uniref:hypothetical protein n=1 Tax=Oligoflexus sp. TaxID=1971216 RepID=UPI002D7E3267|nr:hypothetical protein [Oligoflexus sp.]HET9238468.1 hypothetical protein [Oligoflexus sp.]